MNSPIDALLIINHLNRGGAGDVETLVNTGVISIETGPFLDVDGSGSVIPLDALRIINRLNREAVGFGEAPPQVASLSDVTLGAAEWMESQGPAELSPEDAANIAIAQVSEHGPVARVDDVLQVLADDDEDDDSVEDIDAFWSTF